MVDRPGATPTSTAAGGTAVIIGATGGIGRALVEAARKSGRFRVVLALSRSSDPVLDMESETSIREAAQQAAEQEKIRLVIDATGFLHGDGLQPEKSWRNLEASHMARAFAVNAIGPALLMKHFLPLLPRAGKSAFATLSAKVGSIADNRLGGWYSYRASKAALNQLVRTAAIELKRTHPEALCVALHPGTTETSLSAPFSKAGLTVQTPDISAGAILACLERLGPDASGGFFDHTGDRLPW
jgi:NAD(P)-dependent dehydrogenase (short-subunit alcohol dehydrogenase family)